MRKFVMVLLAMVPGVLGQERKIEPSWLYRGVASLHEHKIDLSSGSCHYTAIFGEGDAEARVPVSIARFGELTVDGQGVCQTVEYARQEELFFVLEGNGLLRFGDEQRALAKDDFTYVAPTVRHSISNPSDQRLRLVVATVKIPEDIALSPAAKLEKANLSELKEQVVGGHPKSVLYKLMIGPHTAARDRINAAYNVADFFLMDFAPNGTNFPHHHEVAEEIYLVLDGEGKMAAGGGMDGVEGLHPAKAGDAYYFRQNCTVGFYNQNTPDAKAHILAVRAYVQQAKERD
jgi:mannose-6-phosphate isomerase-like protein (cupin superfamily)